MSELLYRGRPVELSGQWPSDIDGRAGFVHTVQHGFVPTARIVRKPEPATVLKRPRRAKSQERIRFYKSPEWLAARDKCLDALGRVCTKCGSTEQINVDHIKPRSKFPDLALVQSNLRPLCWPCNRAKAARIEEA